MGNFLDGLLGGIRNIKENGTPKPTRDTLDVVGATITDDGEKLTMTITAPSRFGALADGLRNTIGDEEGQIEFLRGFSTDGDGGGGYFKWRASATATDDGGTILNKDGFGNARRGYWERVFSGPLDVRWFGAVGDDSADDTTAIQRAIDVAIAFDVNTGFPKRIIFPPGTYKITAPLLVLKKNGDEYDYVSVHLDGISRSVSGTGRRAKIHATHVNAPALILQKNSSSIIENLYFVGQNSWPETSGKIPQQFGPHADFNDSIYVVSGCRENRYSPHAAIAVDPFFKDSGDSVADQYPGLTGYYTNTGNGASTACRFTGLEIVRFVVDIVVTPNYNPVAHTNTQNAEGFLFQDCILSDCKSALAICQEQSRAMSVINCTIGNAMIGIDCVRYGKRQGGAPKVIGGLFGSSRWAICTNGAGDGLVWFGSYLESVYSLGIITGGLQSSNSIKGLTANFVQTAQGYRDAVRLWIAGPLELANCTFTQQASAEAADADVANRPVIVYSDVSFPVTFDGVDVEIVAADPDHAQRMTFVTLAQYNVRQYNSHEDTNAANEALFDSQLRRETSSNFTGIMGSPGATIAGVFASDFGSLREFDRRMRWIEPGDQSITVNADGTASFTGSNLDRQFCVGDLLYSLTASTPTMPGSAATAISTVAGYLGKVTAVSSGQVDFNAAEYVAEGTATQYVIIPWCPRHVGQITASCDFGGDPTHLTSVSPTGHLQVGMRVLDKAGRIALGTYIKAVDVGAATATLSKAATGGSGVEALKVYADTVWETPQLDTYGDTRAPGNDGDALIRQSDGTAKWQGVPVGSLPAGSADQVLVTSGGVATFAKLIDANVDAAAAIAGTKIAPDFGSQNLISAGALDVGSSAVSADAFAGTTLESGAALLTNTGRGRVTEEQGPSVMLTDGSATAVYSIVLDVDENLLVFATVHARKTDGTSALYRRVAYFKRVAGVTTQVGSTQVLGTDIEDGGATTWDASIGNSGDTISVTLTAEADVAGQADVQSTLSGWFPTELAETILWAPAWRLRGFSEADPVGRYKDASAALHTLLQAITSKRPLYRATDSPTGKAAVEFDGVNDFVRALFTYAQPAHIFILAKMLTAPAAGDTLFDGHDGNTARLYFTGSTTAAIVAAAGDTPIQVSGLTPTAWTLYEAQFNGANSKLIVDNGTPATGTLTGTSPGGLIVGLFGDQLSAPVDCQVADIVALDAIASAADRARIIAYFNSVHGLGI